MDFALWKSSKEGEPWWDSPWGHGRPGWHIECSVMSVKYLAETFDIHGGGRDLIFPHHENELAQATADHKGSEFARYWLHNGFVNIGGEKMAKSLGNFFTIREILSRYPGEALRHYLLGTHYRSPINFEVQPHCPSCGAAISPEEAAITSHQGCGASFDVDAARAAITFPGVEESAGRVRYQYETLAKADSLLAEAGVEAVEGQGQDGMGSRFVTGFHAAMEDDFNTAAALGEVSVALRHMNELSSKIEAGEKGALAELAELRQGIALAGRVLGLMERPAEEFLAGQKSKALGDIGLSAEEIEQLIIERAEARTSRNWARADEIRDELAERGVSLRDGAEGTTWSVSGS